MPKTIQIYLLLLFGALLLACRPVQAQFYNGLNMSFGKNRVQFPREDVLESEFFASFYRHDRFDVYFYPDGQQLAEYVSRFAGSELTRLENFFEYSLNKKLIFLVYNRLNDYRQSNVGLISGREETNIGGVTNLIDNKVFLYFEGDYKKIDQQILAAITDVILQEMLYGGSTRDRLTNSALLNLPTWYYDGLVSFISKGWDVEIENRVKDGILSGQFEKFNHLQGREAIDAGHSIWYFVSETFGKSLIPTIVYFSKINRSASAGFMNVLGTSLSALSYEWLYFFKSRFDDPAHQGEMPTDGQIKLRNRKGTEYLRARISPDGRYIAYVSNTEGKIKVYLFDERSGKSKRIFQSGARLGQIEDRTFPVLAWHPTSQLLAMTMEHKGKMRYSLYSPESRKWEHQEIKLYDKILDFSFSDDGLNIVLSGTIKGQSDIFVYNLVANTSERITNDRADDFSPRFINHSSAILFVSNRTNLSIEQQKLNDEVTPGQNVFIYDYKTRSDELIPIAGDSYIDRLQPYQTKDRTYYFLGDDNGIRNRYKAQYDSTIVAIDTTVHYTYFSKTAPLTNYARNILDHSIASETGTFTELLFHNNRYNLYRGELPNESASLNKPRPTPFRLKLTRDLARQDSISRIQEIQREERKVITRPFAHLGRDSLSGQKREIDINNYTFSLESLAQGNHSSLPGQGQVKDPITGRSSDLPPIRVYQPAFYVNYLASQVDFTFLNASYQSFSGAAPYYNPGLNMLFLVGTQDLFEDYKVTGGVRFGSNFDSNEYLLSVENLKKRLDKEIIFHRQVYKTITNDWSSYVKATTQELFGLLKYPFSQVSALKGTLNLRLDEYAYLSTDQYNMIKEGEHKLWAGVKLEYIFDNARMIGLNLYDGIRSKVFGEYYQQVNGDWSDVFILGADFRHYLPLHRSLIWANRLATSTSFGGSRLIYYMGGVDNWYNISRNVPTFDYYQPIDGSQEFVYQALATNMRGFSQNIRNGNSFAVFNTEVRWPVFRYFANKPLNSDFLTNFQLVGFFDIGTAWSGPSPWDKRNHLNREVIRNGPMVIVVDKGNEPFVAGFGAGVRSRLLGYFVRLDWAWGIENYVLLPRIFYLSLSLDF
ncbi:MAG: hypothetical protein WCY83_04600 [Bacteroidales bacterium]